MASSEEVVNDPIGRSLTRLVTSYKKVWYSAKVNVEVFMVSVTDLAKVLINFTHDSAWPFCQAACGVEKVHFMCFLTRKASRSVPW